MSTVAAVVLGGLVVLALVAIVGRSLFYRGEYKNRDKKG